MEGDSLCMLSPSRPPQMCEIIIGRVIVNVVGNSLVVRITIQDKHICYKKCTLTQIVLQLSLTRSQQ